MIFSRPYSRGFTPHRFAYMYVLESVQRAGELYVGCTRDLRKRLTEHNTNRVRSTKRYVPWKLLYYEAFSDEKLAWERESKLKAHGNAMRELKKRIGVRTIGQSGAGFTLIETIIYLGLFGIVMSGLIVSAFYLLDSGQRTAGLIAVQEEGTFVNRKLSWAIGSATDAAVSGATELTLSRLDLPSDENPITISYDATEKRIMLQRGSHTALPLTSDVFEVTDVHFSVVHDSLRPPYVGVTFKIGEDPFRLDMYLRK